MAAPVTPKMIERRVVFGVRESVKDGIHYLDDNNIAWVAGKSIVVLDTQLGTQQLIPCTPPCEDVTAMSIAPSRKVLAVAESSRNPVIVIYLYDPTSVPKLRRKKVLHIPDLGSNEYVSLCFSQDGRQLVALGGFPEWTLVYWDIEKMKVLASCTAADPSYPSKDRRHITQCTISPNDSSLVCVSGVKFVKFYELNDTQLKVYNGGLRDGASKYLAHVWIPSEPSRLIVSTENGDLLLVENKEYKFPLPLSPSDGLTINALASYTKGFVCGGDMGLITVFEKTDSKELYRKIRTFRFNSGSGDATLAGGPNGAQSLEIPTILAFTLTPPPTEEYLAFLTSTKQIYCMNLPNADFIKGDERVFQPVGQPFHSGPITGVDSSVQRPLVVTAGRDRCIFLWNTVTNSVQLRKQFNADILSIAIHPSGLHLLVGFTDSLKLMNIYSNDICEYKSIAIRSCPDCRFSNGGQFFAAIHSTTIHVYFTYTCELLGHLRGHNGKVKNICFAPPDDTRLLSVGADGAVFEFNLCDFHKLRDNVLKAVSYHCGVADTDTIWTAGNDRRLRQMDRSTLQLQTEYEIQNTSIASMAISSKLKLLFSGCEDGTVRVFNTYIGEKYWRDKENAANRTITIETHHTHTGLISKLTLTNDESMIITVGEDGLVSFWDVVAPHRGMKKEPEYAAEILMDRREMEDAARQVLQLTSQVEDLKSRMTQLQAKRERVHEEQLAKLEKEYAIEKAKQNTEMDHLESEKNEQAIRFTEFMAELEHKHRETLRQTAEDYDVKIGTLMERAEQFERLLLEHREGYRAQVEALEAAAMARRVQGRAAHQEADRQADQMYQDLLLEKELDDGRTEEMSKWIEEDTDGEIIHGKEMFERRKREQEEEIAALQAANQAMQSKENLYRADLEAKKADVKEKLRQQAALESQMDAAKRDIEALTNELRERGETIADKDNRIQELKKKNQELEKFRFVLEYKIKELKAQIDPRDEEIRNGKEKLSSMESEVEQYRHSNENLVLQIRSLRQKRAGQKKELKKLSEKMKASQDFQSRLWTELSDIRETKNPSTLKSMAKALFDKYTSTKTTFTPKALSSRTAADEVRDYNRERDHLERNLASLKGKAAKDAENYRADKNRIIAENVILIREINDLRKEARSLATKAGVLTYLDPTGISPHNEEAIRELQAQKPELYRLQQLAESLEKKMKDLGIEVSGVP